MPGSGPFGSIETSSSVFVLFSFVKSTERRQFFPGTSSETAGNLQDPAVWGERGYREFVAKPAFRCKAPTQGAPQEPRDPFSQHCEFRGRNFFQKFGLRIRELYCSGFLGPDYCRIALTAIDFAIPGAAYCSSFLPPIDFLTRPRSIALGLEIVTGMSFHAWPDNEVQDDAFVGQNVLVPRPAFEEP